MTNFCLRCALFLMSTTLMANPLLKDVRNRVGDKKLEVEYIFDQSIEGNKVQLEYINQTLQLTMNRAGMSEEKRLKRVGKKNIKSIYTYQPNKEKLRTRIIYEKPFQVSTLKGRVRIQKNDRILKVIVDKSEVGRTPIVFQPPYGLDQQRETSAVEVLEQELKKYENVEVKTNAVKKAVDEEKIAKVKTTEKKSKPKSSEVELNIEASAGAVLNKDAPESEIPVFKKTKVESKESSSALMRIMMSLIIVILCGVGIVFFGKWWSKKYKKNDLNTQMIVMSQYHLGPKKSLTIVRVAGEYILLGVTDQNINMIKSLSFIDDEVPIQYPVDFQNELKKDHTVVPKMKEDEQMAIEEMNLSSIADVVNNKLEGMRTL